LNIFKIFYFFPFSSDFFYFLSEIESRRRFGKTKQKLIFILFCTQLALPLHGFQMSNNFFSAFMVPK